MSKQLVKQSPLKGKPQPNVRMYYDAVVKDINGKITRKKRGLCHSFLGAQIYIMNNMAGGSQGFTWTDTLGVSKSPVAQTYGQVYINSLANDDTIGLVVGTGTNAVTINDTKLQTKILQGAAAGKLQYSAHAFGAPYTDATASYFTVARVYTNASGGTITINEIGIYAYVYFSAAYNFCLVRDKLSVGISVPNGQSLTLTYTIKVSV